MHAYEDNDEDADKDFCVRVVVRTIAGDELHLEAPPDSTVTDLKREVDQHFSVPLLCQQLVIGTEVLEDSEPLISFVSEAHPIIEIVVVVVKQKLLDIIRNWVNLENLEGPNYSEAGIVVGFTMPQTAESLEDRSDAVKSLCDVAEQGDEEVVEVLLEVLLEDCVTMVGPACNALAKVAVPGDERVIVALVETIHRMLAVRNSLSLRSSVRAVAQVASAGHQGAIDACRSVLAAKLESFVESEARDSLIVLTVQTGEL